MYYRIWAEKDFTGLSSKLGIEKLYTEIDDTGEVFREIGIGKDGKLVHKCPSNKFRYGTHGLLDNIIVIITEDSPLITKEEFERMWDELQ